MVNMSWPSSFLKLNENGQEDRPKEKTMTSLLIELGTTMKYTTKIYE